MRLCLFCHWNFKSSHCSSIPFYSLCAQITLFVWFLKLHIIFYGTVIMNFQAIVVSIRNMTLRNHILSCFQCSYKLSVHILRSIYTLQSMCDVTRIPDPLDTHQSMCDATFKQQCAETYKGWSDGLGHPLDIYIAS